ncbi:HTTM domain-containing protein [Streptomyces sp. RB6PN25]|uniref:HTTM domain-containing protein n=1 Tax=Streptomyces humicola TaxID=2953240 RepID=A0ABT1PZW9_9ACTN|nr:HTTM domain-containing protein [Streptomyces humicola]MCQ4083216.1 HTTM domain-containing protein [Streptomyces humicola]
MPRKVDAAIGKGLARITGGPVAPYQSAVIRIGFSLTWLAFLLREWVHRDELYGPDSPWSWSMARALIATNHAFTVLMWSDSRAWFEFVYAAAIAASVMLLVGWRTRTASLLFMIGVLALQNRSVFEGDGGDNVIHIMAIYLVFARCGQVWSLDARRARRSADRDRDRDWDRDRDRDPVGIVMWVVFAAVLALVTVLGKLSTGWALILWGFLAAQAAWWLVRRYAPGEPRTVMTMVGNVVHAGAMLVIVVEVCLIYSTAGWYKITGSRWEDGTALYYPLHLADFTPWPALSHALGSSGLIVMLITYGTVAVQVAFPFTLFNRRVKNVLLVMMMCEHAGIAVVLGLPFFSLAMITADSVFLPTSFLRWVGDRVVRALPGRRAVVPRQRSEGEPSASTLPV